MRFTAVGSGRSDNDDVLFASGGAACRSIVLRIVFRNHERQQVRLGTDEQQQLTVPTPTSHLGHVPMPECVVG